MRDMADINVSFKITKEFMKDNPKGMIRGNIRDLQNKELKERALRGIRGNIITASIGLEKQLDYLISNLLFGGIKNRESKPHIVKGEIRFFEEFILNTLFVSFESKLRIFRNLYKVHPFLIEHANLSKDLARDIGKVIEWRNRFAHGETIFKLLAGGKMSENPYLFYYTDNKQQEQVMDDAFFDEIINPLFSGAYNKIGELRDKVKEMFDKGNPEFED